MILANTAVADWAANQGLPILFRNHEANPVTGTGSSVAKELLVAAADPAHFERVRVRMQSTLRRAAYSATVHGHYALSLAAYTHATSPLRRLADLVTQRVIFAHLDGVAQPYGHRQLARIAEELNHRITAEKEAKSEMFKQRDRRTTALAATADLSALDVDRWSKVLAAVVGHQSPAVPADIATELRRRACSGELLARDLAVLITADAGWRPILEEVFRSSSAAHPEFGPSVLSIVMQEQEGTAECEVRDDGPPHARRFAARISTPSARGAWALGSTKKHATHAAAWNFLDVLTGLAPSAAEDQQPEFQRRLPNSAPKSSGATAPDDRPAHRPATTGAQSKARARALRNPVAWLNSHVPTPQWSDSRSGPDHAPKFECVVTLEGQRCSGTATTKSAAKVAAATAMVEALFTAATEPP